MLDTSARLLRLLSLLQTRRDWGGPELAERLGVSARTLRRDVERLRDLGYPVHATPGVAGGYRLGVGAALPPLLLDDEEAVAVAVTLRSGAAGGVAGIEETSVRALAKLEQVLPSRLRRRVNAFQAFTVAMPGTGPAVDVDVLTALTAACRDHERLRFDYTGHDGSASERFVEPHRLVSRDGRWYLVAWDLGRGDWRVFRADRIRPRTPTGPRFAPRDFPGGDVVAFVARRMGAEMWPCRARVRVHAPAEAVAGRISGVVEPIDDRSCALTVSGDSLRTIAVILGFLDEDFDVVEPPGLDEHLAGLAARYQRAAGRREEASGTRRAGKGG
ncbi:helix-turn-helix transcriptional regulator [Microtetraspora niveoalba]|uniref:helix-turn-helix transcriptional regulator n=1 Tax=Microtetraspora niveoalba TaxID=46175 RepID=UPI00082D5BA5|nr:YafY family protein [Microtetraspora niveoalba]